MRFSSMSSTPGKFFPSCPSKNAPSSRPSRPTGSPSSSFKSISGNKPLCWSISSADPMRHLSLLNRAGIAGKASATICLCQTMELLASSASLGFSACASSLETTARYSMKRCQGRTSSRIGLPGASTRTKPPTSLRWPGIARAAIRYACVGLCA